MIIGASQHKKRINIIQNKLKDHEILIIFASSHKIKNRDVEYKFRQDSDYYYLTGITESDGILVLKKDQSIKVSFNIENNENNWVCYGLYFNPSKD